MQIKVTFEDLKEEVREVNAMSRMLLKGLREDVRTVSLAAERAVKAQMPVDTGRARASWGHWTAGDLMRVNTDAGPGDAAWTEDNLGLSIEQGSNVEYIGALNDGHSTQAPAGFIDVIEDRAHREFEARVDARLGRL